MAELDLDGLLDDLENLEMSSPAARKENDVNNASPRSNKDAAVDLDDLLKMTEPSPVNSPVCPLKTSRGRVLKVNTSHSQLETSNDIDSILSSANDALSGGVSQSHSVVEGELASAPAGISPRPPPPKVRSNSRNSTPTSSSKSSNTSPSVKAVAVAAFKEAKPPVSPVPSSSALVDMDIDMATESNPTTESTVSAESNTASVTTTETVQVLDVDVFDSESEGGSTGTSPLTQVTNAGIIGSSSPLPMKKGSSPTSTNTNKSSGANEMYNSASSATSASGFAAASMSISVTASTNSSFSRGREGEEEEEEELDIDTLASDVDKVLDELEGLRSGASISDIITSNINNNETSKSSSGKIKIFRALPLDQGQGQVQSDTGADKKRCIKAFIGGSSSKRGIKASSFAKDTVCSNLRCIKCNFSVRTYKDCEWSPTVDYIFLRTNVPNDEKVSQKLQERVGACAYCCQCSWVDAQMDATQDVKTEPSLEWVCSGHCE